MPQKTLLSVSLLILITVCWIDENALNPILLKAIFNIENKERSASAKLGEQGDRKQAEPSFCQNFGYWHIVQAACKNTQVTMKKACVRCKEAQVVYKKDKVTHSRRHKSGGGMPRSGAKRPMLCTILNSKLQTIKYELFYFT